MTDTPNRAGESLLESVPGEEIKRAKDLKSVAADQNGVPVLWFADGSIKPDLKPVVGADGGWSKARRMVGDGKTTLIFQRQGSGCTLAFWPTRNFARDVADSPRPCATLLLSDDFFAPWATEWKDTVRHLGGVRSRPLYHLPPDSVSWKTVPGLTSASGAAHLALSNGEGVNRGMTECHGAGREDGGAWAG
ncbi:LOW QUALITY PROTEIN: FAD binding domain [Geosmithia morbida]|uniref:FAD binding domain n=1 Tax=Geosmithia morbida TaxID=1094350 RepID=A0A9P4YPB1_9HYPO|nr:LOW QUALITY PROTEIN: FAD binding domain [Geosmithia morbida]KAF4119319.1 LOW QUALITY PROTEIN: FAD binding domain [Geosmithia morbida]